MIVPGFIFDSAANFVRPPASGYGLRLYGSSSGSVGLKPAAAAGSTDFQLPAADGSSRQVLATNASAVLSFITLAKADVGLGNVENTALSTWAGSTNLTTLGTIATGVWNGTPISLTSYASGTLQAAQFPALTGNVTTTAGSLATTIGAGVVTNSMLAGSIAASKLVGTDIATVGTITAGTWTGTTIAIANGGTGQTTAPNAINALLPSQTGNNALFLTTNGTVASWGAAGGGSGANPTANVGVNPVNGSASTFLRSDGAPALDPTLASLLQIQWAA